MSTGLEFAMYPDAAAARDRWIVEHRGQRGEVDARHPYAFLLEQERIHTGEVSTIATVFLTNRECPFRCAMCDLWRYTLPHSVAIGDIPGQIAHALAELALQHKGGPARQIKLYNAGSFFDSKAIPPDDYAPIARLVSGFERVIVECHPALVREDCFRFAEMLNGRLEVAMGLETAHPEVLARLNKRMTLADYADASARLHAHAVDLRSFILVQPPFMPPEEALHWAGRSVDFAIECRATAITLIPTRGGNGAMEAFAAAGYFRPPSLSTVEDALDYGIALGRARVFVDLWDLNHVQACPACREERIARMEQMNLVQNVLPRVTCTVCEASR